MKEFIDFIWNMPMWIIFAALGTVFLFIVAICVWFIYDFVKSAKRSRARFNEMETDFDEMKKRVRGSLRR